MSQSFRDPFLADAWKRRAESERGFEQHERLTLIYLELSKVVRKNEAFSELFKKVETAAVKYDLTIATLARMRIEQSGIESIAEADRRRRLAHDALEDELNLLSRSFAKSGLDNSWRYDIGTSREAVGNWARKVAEVKRTQLLKR